MRGSKGRRAAGFQPALEATSRAAVKSTRLWWSRTSAGPSPTALGSPQTRSGSHAARPNGGKLSFPIDEPANDTRSLRKSSLVVIKRVVDFLGVYPGLPK